MAGNNLVVGLFFLLLILLEALYFFSDGEINMKTMRDFTDCLVILIFVLSVYFIVKYFGALEQIPNRITALVQNESDQLVGKDTKQEVDKLINSPEYKTYCEEKEKGIWRKTPETSTGLSNDEGKNNEEIERILLEIEDKEDEIFCN